MIRDAPEPRSPLPPLVAADPFDPRWGAHPAAVVVIGKIKMRARRGDGSARQATGEAVEKALRAAGKTYGLDASPWGVSSDGSSWIDREQMNAPALPPEPGQADPTMDDLVRSGAMNGYTIRKPRRN
jgi:hypothetical protein